MSSIIYHIDQVKKGFILEGLQLLNLPLIKGIDTKNNPIFITDKLLALENAEIKNQKIIKSTGYALLGTSAISSASTNQKLFTYDDNLYKIQNYNVYAYREANNVFSSVGTLRTLTVSRFTAQSNILTQTNIPIIGSVFGNYYCYSNFNSTSNYYEIRICDISTQQVFYTNTQFLTSAGSVLDIVGASSGFFIYSSPNVSLSSCVINETIITYQTFTVSTNASIQTDLFYYAPSSVQVSAKYQYPSFSCKYANGKIFCIYRTGDETACVGKLLVRSVVNTTPFYNNTYTLSVDLTALQGYRNLGAYAIASNDYPFVLFMFGANFYLLNTGTNVNSQEFTYPTPTDEIFQTFNVSVLPDTNEFVFLKHQPLEVTATATCPFLNSYNFVNESWTSGVTYGYTNSCNANYTNYHYGSTLGSCSLAGGVVGLNSIAYFIVAVYSYLRIEISTDVYQTLGNERRCTFFIVDGSYNVVQSISPINAALYTGDADTYGAFYSYAAPPPRIKVNALQISDLSTLSVVYPFLVDQVVYTTSTATTITTSVKLYTVSAVLPNEFFYVDYNNSGYFGSSRLIEIATNVLSEQNFFDFPQIVGVPGTSGSLTVSSNYNYSAIYEWSNGQGEVVRSAQSIIKLITLSDSQNSVTIYFTPFPFFTTKPNAKIKIYRSISNGTTQYLIYSSVLWGLSAYTYTDTISDADLSASGNEVIYTSNNILSDFPFDASLAFTSHNGRVFSIVEENPYVVQYSKPVQFGVALASNPDLEFTIESKSGPLTALASLDDKLILFKTEYIYFVVGDGSNAYGQNSTLTIPLLVNGPVGCVDPNSIVRTPDGIMFKSSKGIYLLDRSLTVSYIGADVEGYNTNTVTSAELLNSQNKVKFSTLEGPVLVYDYYYNTWSTESDLFFVSATVAYDMYTGIDLSGNTYQQSATLYTRNSKNYSMKIKTPWLKPYNIPIQQGDTTTTSFGLQAQMSVKEIAFLGSMESPHILYIGIAYDYVDQDQTFAYALPNQTTGIVNSYGIGSWGTLLVYGGQASSLYRFVLMPVITNCLAIRLTFWDGFQNTIKENGNSFTLSCISMTYVPRRELFSGTNSTKITNTSST